jgi:hypothetical protein
MSNLIAVDVRVDTYDDLEARRLNAGTNLASGDHHQGAVLCL